MDERRVTAWLNTTALPQADLNCSNLTVASSCCSHVAVSKGVRRGDFGAVLTRSDPNEDPSKCFCGTSSLNMIYVRAVVPVASSCNAIYEIMNWLGPLRETPKRKEENGRLRYSQVGTHGFASLIKDKSGTPAASAFDALRHMGSLSFSAQKREAAQGALNRGVRAAAVTCEPHQRGSERHGVCSPPLHQPQHQDPQSSLNALL